MDSRPIVRGTDLRDARVAADAMDRPITAFTLSQDAAARFEQYTKAHIGQRSGIVLDEEILSIPVIEDVFATQARFGVRAIAKRPRISPPTCARVHSLLRSKLCRRGLWKHLSAPTPSVTGC